MYALFKYKRYIYFPQWNQEEFSQYHSKLFSQKCHFIRESSRKQFKDYCNTTPHNITYWHHTIDYTLLKCTLTLFSIWMWAVCALSIALMQDRQEDSNIVGDDPKMDSKPINKLFNCYYCYHLYLFLLLFSWWKWINNVTSWKIFLEKLLEWWALLAVYGSS